MNRIILNFKENEVLIAEIASGINSSSVKKAVHLPLETNLSGSSLYNNENNITSLKNILQGFYFNVKKAEIILSFDGMITRTIETPYLNKKDLKSFIDNNISNYFTINPDEFYFDYKILNTKKNDKKLFDVLLAAIPRQKTDDIIYLVKTCGLKPVKIGIYPDCIYKLFTHKKDNVIGIFDINRTKSNIIILDKGQMFLYSNIQAEVTENEYDEIMDNLGYFLNFYSARHFGNRVEQIYCIGELSQDENLINVINQQFGIETHNSPAARGVGFTNELMDISGYLLKSEKIENKDLNFSEILEERKTKSLFGEKDTLSVFKIAIALFTIIFMVGGLLLVFIENKIYDTSRISSELQNYKSTEKELASLENTQNEANRKNNYLQYAKNDGFDYYSILQTIQNGLPENISVSALTVSKTSVTATFNIKDSTLDVARLNIALNNMKIFDHEEIVNTSLNDTVKTCTYNLTLNIQGKK